MTKIGQKKDGNKRMKIKPISDKKAKDLREYRTLKDKLISLSHGKSEISGKIGYYLDIHHIEGRVGDNLTAPFNLIVVTREEHDLIHKHNSFEKKEELRELVKPIRLVQGFKEEEYL